MPSPDEQKAILAELTRRGGASVQRLLTAAQSTSDPWAYLVAAYPDLASSLAIVAGDLAATWYEDLSPSSPYIAKPTAAPPLEQLQANARWGLMQADVMTALSGSLTRVVLNGARDTTIENATAEGVKWARHASANACSFCRMLATRGSVYASEASATRVGGRGKVAAPSVPGVARHGRPAGGLKVRGNQSLGDKFHDHCHCMAVAVRAGGTYTPPSYVEAWHQQYLDAAAMVPGVPTAKTLTQAWDALLAGTT